MSDQTSGGDKDLAKEVDRLRWTHSSVKQGDAKAMKYLRQDAEQGLAEAQWRLGMCYLKGHGHGIRRDRNEAVKWFYKAAIQGYAGAQYQLGDCYLRERGVNQNDAEAVKWFTKAAEQGDKDATQKLPSLLERMKKVASLRQTAQKRKAKEIEKYHDAANRGDAEAQYRLALIHCGEANMFKEEVFTGYVTYSPHYKYYKTSPSPDYTKAAKWFLKAAEQGHIEAQCKISDCYFRGIGVPQNPTEALMWLRKANRLLKRTELVERLKSLATIELPQDISRVAMCYVPRTPTQSEIRRAYKVALNHVQSYGVDATLICGAENFYLEINYPDRPEPIRVKLESASDLELMERFLAVTDRYVKKRINNNTIFGAKIFFPIEKLLNLLSRFISFFRPPHRCQKNDYKECVCVHPLQDNIDRLAELFGINPDDQLNDLQ